MKTNNDEKNKTETRTIFKEFYFTSRIRKALLQQLQFSFQLHKTEKETEKIINKA